MRVIDKRQMYWKSIIPCQGLRNNSQSRKFFHEKSNTGVVVILSFHEKSNTGVVVTLSVGSSSMKMVILGC